MKRIFLLVLLSVASIGLLYKLQVHSSTPTSITLANVEALTEEEELPGWRQDGMIAIYDTPPVDDFFECCTDIQVVCYENCGYLKTCTEKDEHTCEFIKNDDKYLHEHWVEHGLFPYED